MNTPNNPDVQKSELQIAVATIADMAGLLKTLTDLVDGGLVIGLQPHMEKIAALTVSTKEAAAKIQRMADHEQSQNAIDALVHGDGAEEYQVLLTLDTTAARFVRIRADSPSEAGDKAHSLAVEEQGAYFTLNDGNHVRFDDVSVTCVMDPDGNEYDIENEIGDAPAL